MQELTKRIGYEFLDPELLEQAFTHRSYRHENLPGSAGDNERFEFLGDAVLGFVVARLLFERFPERREGELSRMRAHVVSAHHLAKKSRELGLGGELRLGRGEDASGGREKDSILADAFESLIAGIYLDGGLGEAERFIVAQFAADFGQFDDTAGLLRDYKSHLQEALHARGGAEPEYSLVETTGPEHRKVFEVAVSVDGCQVATGFGSSKKSAQQAAARDAIEKLNLG